MRLIDADERRKEIDEEDRWVVDLAEAIIEADKAETEQAGNPDRLERIDK